MTISSIRKRDGRVVEFDSKRILDAIHKAFLAVELKNGGRAKKLTEEIVRILEGKFKQTPSVENIQDTVIYVLKNNGFSKVALEYQNYREKKKEIRILKQKFGVLQPKLTVNALEVLKRRYLLRNEKAKIIETPAQMFMRVAKAVAMIDEKYLDDKKRSEKIFYEMISNLDFIPNSPTLFNAGTSLCQLSACFVLPLQDSLRSIFDTLRDMALIEQTGGGVGLDFSKLRPKGDLVQSTYGVASGPVSFMNIFDAATETIKAGGKRRGAMMGLLRVDHPDIKSFITSKQRNVLSNFNLSVAVTDSFMRKVEENKTYHLINPRNNEKIKIKANDIWDLITESAWKSGDPGVIFIDKINRHNPTPELGKIEATNPCGEQPLLPYESCNLGSINLSRMITEEKINWQKLRNITRQAVHFLDNIIDLNCYPLLKTEKITKGNRKIGLGVMGFADMLIQLGISYDSVEALEIAEKVMYFIQKEARKKSVEIGEKRGSFPNFEHSIWKDKYTYMRNATLTTIAPTGSISIIAGCSSGIEPLFAISFMRNVLDGTRLFETNPLFERFAKEKGFYSSSLLEKIARFGSVKNIKGIPYNFRQLFVTALDLKPETHVKIQAAFQKYTDNAVSKTVNLPYEADINDVKRVYKLAWKLGCKGITVFRYGSKSEQVLYIGGKNGKKGFIAAKSEYAGGCPNKSCDV